MALTQEFLVAQEESQAYGINVPMHSGSVIQAQLATTYAQAGGNNTQFTVDAMGVGANWIGDQTTSSAPFLQYSQYYTDVAVLADCGVNLGTVNWLQFTPRSVVFSPGASPTSWTASGSVPLNSLGPVTTQSLTCTYNSTSSSTSTLLGDDANNVQIYAITNTQNGSADTVQISGQGAVYTGNNATVTVAAGASVTVSGQNDNVVFAGAGSASVIGTGDTVQLNSNDTLTLPGQATGSDPTPQEQVTVYNSGATGDIVNAGSGIEASLNVTNATINSTLFSGNTEGLTVNGNLDHVNSSGANILFNGDGDSITLNAGNNVVAAGLGAVVSVASGTSYQNSCYLAGDQSTFNIGSNISSSLAGFADTANLSGSDIVTLVNGQSNMVTNVIAGDTVALDSNTSADITGSGGTIDLDGTGTSLAASNENIAFNSLSSSVLNDDLLGNHDVLSDPTGNGYSAVKMEGQYDTGSLDNIAITAYGSDTGDSFSDPGGSFSDDTNAGDYDFGATSSDECSDGFDPVVLNLKGAAVSTVGLASSGVYFDMENTGTQIHTGWGTAGEGYLVLDPANTNTVTNEHSLVSSFNELQDLDSNHDGVLNSLDAAWSELKVWTDAAGNGIFTSGSMQTLSALGISSINLKSTHVARNSNNNTILDDSTFTWNNGTTGDIAGVAFTFDQNTLRPVSGGGGGGGGGGGTCVQYQSLLPGGGTAGEVKEGDRMELADESTLEAATGIVTYSERKTAPGYRIVTVSGIALVCSDTAPIPTRRGLILAPALMGHDVAVRKDEGGSSLIGWEKVASVTAVGQIEIQHISINEKCFWAGASRDSFILHHNKTHPLP